MGFKVTFAGVDRTEFVRFDPPPSMTRKQNERSLFSLMLNPGFVPNKLDDVVMYDVDGVTPVIGGIVMQRSTAGIEPGAGTFLTDVQCSDYLTYTDWCFWTKTYAAPVTLKTILQNLITDKLGVYGITLDAAQDDGDTFEPFSVLGIKVSEFLRSLGTQCTPPRVIRISPLKAIRMLVPGTESAPVVINDAEPNCLSFEWTDSTFIPANYVTLLCGPTGTALARQQWISDHIATSWVTDIAAADPPPTLVEINNGVTPYLATVGPGGMYTWDRATHTLSLGTDTLPLAGTKITLGPKTALGDAYDTDGFTAIYPFSVFATSGASPRIEAQYSNPNQLLFAPAQAEVDGLLTELNQNPREATVVTLVGGFNPGQSLSVTLASRNVSAATFSVTQVQAELTEFMQSGLRMWHYTLSVTETTVYQGSYLDQMRDMIGSGSGAAPIISSGGGGGGSTTVLSSPFPLGGSRSASLAVGTTSTPVIDWLPFIATSNQSIKVRVTVRARVGGVAVTPVLTRYDSGSMTWISFAPGSAASGVTESEQLIYAVLVAGTTYRLEYFTNVVGASAYAIGQIEST